LFKADVLDCYGDKSFCKGPEVNHRVPQDVSKKELEYYGSFAFVYMEFEDLLFYLYPVALYYEQDWEIDAIHSLLMSLERHHTKIAKLAQEDQDALIAGLKWIWFSGDSRFALWSECENLQRIIGVETFEHDL